MLLSAELDQGVIINSLKENVIFDVQSNEVHGNISSIQDRLLTEFILTQIYPSQYSHTFQNSLGGNFIDCMH